MDALEQLPDALADGVRARVGRATQAEDDVLVGVARDVAAGHHPGAVGRAAELERRRARDQRAVEVEERRAALAVAANGAAARRRRECAGALSPVWSRGRCDRVMRHTCTMIASPCPPPGRIAASRTRRRAGAARARACRRCARRMPRRVPERDRAAVDVHALAGRRRGARRLQRDRGEGLVDLPQVDVVRLQAGLVERVLGRVGGVRSEPGELVRDRRLREDRGQDLLAVALGPAPRRPARARPRRR